MYVCIWFFFFCKTIQETKAKVNENIYLKGLGDWDRKWDFYEYNFLQLGCVAIIFILLFLWVVSESLQLHGLTPARLLCPWDSPGKNAGVGCHFLLQGIFPTQGWNPRLLLGRWIFFTTESPGKPHHIYNCLLFTPLLSLSLFFAGSGGGGGSLLFLLPLPPWIKHFMWFNLLSSISMSISMSIIVPLRNVSVISIYIYS